MHVMSAMPHVHKKRLGQHFLHDPGILRRIVQAIAPRRGERIVEIGPGAGALTIPLLREAGVLTAIELDRELVPRLREAAAGVGELTILQADALEVDFGALAGAAPLRLVGNLPYNISTPILFHCLAHLGVIADMHFMLQREVVERMAATPGGKTYGRLSVMLQLACTVDPLLRVPAGAFTPPPKVESAVVRLVPKAATARPPRELETTIATLVRAAFGQRRKTLANALRGIADADAMRAAGVDPGTRAERLAPESYVALARALAAT
jgi:16S rRNA (adenine1518-N6/adenine1519-N6)-dimethyltransferase